MIRLTEVEHRGPVIDLRIEGQLTERDLPVLAQELGRYRSQSIEQVRLLADGLVSISPRISVERCCPDGVEVRFATRRASLYRLLVSYGQAAELLP